MIWSHDGRAWQHVSFAKCLLGAEVYLCCPGPSLADVDPTLLYRPGVVTIAVNRAYPKVKPNYWIGMDHPSAFSHTLLWEPFVKLFRNSFAESLVLGRKVCLCPNTHFIEIDPTAHPIQMFERRGHDVKFTAPLLNSFETALHFAVWIGAQRIHLVGCDFGGGRDYHDGIVLTEEQRALNKRLYDAQARRLGLLRQEGEANGIQIISCTPGSKANDVLPYIPLAEALDATSSRVVPVAWTPTLDCRDAEHCRWGHNVMHERGVVVGVSKEQTDLLDWWYRCYSEHNPTIPVAFACFGVDAEWKEWCGKRGIVYDVAAPKNAQGWFRKPSAILQAPFRKVLWLDLDTEVRGPIGKHFADLHDGQVVSARTDLMSPPEYAKTRDATWFGMTKAPHCCTGIFGTEHGNPMVEEWATNCLDPKEFDYKGDNEILSVILDRRKTPVVWAASADYGLARQPADPEARILHYAGADKEKLRAKKSSVIPSAKAPGQDKLSRMDDDEITKIFEMIDAAPSEPVRILEIGILNCGTGMTMMRRCAHNGKRFVYVGVDPLQAVTPHIDPDLYHYGSIYIVPGPSTDVVESVRGLCPQFDLVVVDGCHCVECVEADWQNYSQFVAPGGFLAFHDTKRQSEGSCSPGTPHAGGDVRPTYEHALATQGWADFGEVGKTFGLGCLRRTAPSP